MIEPGAERADVADESQQSLDLLVDSCAAEGYKIEAGAVDYSYAAGATSSGNGGNGNTFDDDTTPAEDDDELELDDRVSANDEGAAVGLRSSVLSVAGAVGGLLLFL